MPQWCESHMKSLLININLRRSFRVSWHHIRQAFKYLLQNPLTNSDCDGDCDSNASHCVVRIPFRRVFKWPRHGFRRNPRWSNYSQLHLRWYLGAPALWQVTEKGHVTWRPLSTLFQYSISMPDNSNSFDVRASVGFIYAILESVTGVAVIPLMAGAWWQ